MMPGEALIECREHGPMDRISHQQVLVAVRCGTCGRQPIDLLQDAHVTATAGALFEELMNGDGDGDDETGVPLEAVGLAAFWQET